MLDFFIFWWLFYSYYLPLLTLSLKKGDEIWRKTNLKEVREAYGMTQQDLADQVGIRRETIVHLENNRYNPSLEMTLKIAQVFNKQVEELFRLK